MDDFNDDQLGYLIILKAVEIFHKDFDEYMSKFIEVRGLSVTFLDIKEPKNDYFQIIYN